MATAEDWRERIEAATLLTDILDQISEDVGSAEATWIAQFVAAYATASEDVEDETAVSQSNRMRAAIRTAFDRLGAHDIAEVITELRLEDPDV